MSKKHSPTMIGAFALGALALLALGLVLFGGRQLFAENNRFVTYFQGSVKGLRIGSNVVFRGVRIGYVTDIQLVSDARMSSFSIPVVFEVLPGAFTIRKNGGSVSAMTSEVGNTPQSLVAAGLRAQLDVESFVTGQLIINLDMRPDQPAVFRGGGDTSYFEIPSIQSDIQQALEKVQRFLTVVQNQVPLEQIVAELQGALHGLNRLANSPELEATLVGLNRLINSEGTQKLPGSLNATLGDFRLAITEIHNVLSHVDAKIDPLAGSLDASLRQLDRTLGSAEQTLSAAGGQLRTDSENSYQLKATLKELEDTARSLRVLLDYLEQHPEALIRGKSRP
jgi:paraquat-inducible protein B